MTPTSKLGCHSVRRGKDNIPWLLQVGCSPEAVGGDLEGGAQGSSVCVAVRIHSSRAGLQ